MDVDHLESWRYRAFGKVVSIKPVLVDCGLLSVEGVVHTHDPRVIGEYVAFTISRLGGSARAIQPPGQRGRARTAGAC
jgi:hypothetical protein